MEHNNLKTTTTPFPHDHAVLAGLLSRSKGPGGLYNVGNLIALLGGFIAFNFASSPDLGIAPVLWAYLFGSFGTSYLTLAIAIFLLSGEAYHRAWQNPSSPVVWLNRLGDLLGGIAAVILTFALASFGETTLAIVSGSILALGKFGTALVPERQDMSKSASVLTSSLRIMVIVSRVPAITSLGYSLVIFMIQGGDRIGATMALIMFISYWFWLCADYLLVANSAKAKA